MKKNDFAYVDGVCNHCGKELSEDWCFYLGKVCQVCKDKIEDDKNHNLG